MHLHTDFSGDSNSSPEDMIVSCIEKGLKYICITDHYDMESYDYEVSKFNPDIYFKTLLPLKEKYRDKINIGIGVEIGIQPGYISYINDLIKSNSFEFVIGSTHEIEKRDPAFKYDFKTKSDKEVYRSYFEQILKNITLFKNYNVLGHLDYVVRYGKEREVSYSYIENAEIIDEILKILISEGKGIEVNTSGLKYALPFPHPCPEIIKRYKELGGEVLTIGSDAHKPEHIAYEFDKVYDIISKCGFEYYTIFHDGKPQFYKLR